MVTEIALLTIAQDHRAEFEALMAGRGRELLTAAPGSRSVTLSRCVEEPATYALVVEWDSVAAHEEATRDPAFLAFRDLQRSLHSAPPVVRHFVAVAA